jgi:hypothetical protein
MKQLSKLLGLSNKSLIYMILLVLLIVSITLSVTSIDWFIEYSSLPVGLTKSIIGILVLAIIDDVVFGEINTIQQIKDKNIGYALIYLANAIIIAAGIGLA